MKDLSDQLLWLSNLATVLIKSSAWPLISTFLAKTYVTKIMIAFWTQHMLAPLFMLYRYFAMNTSPKLRRLILFDYITIIYIFKLKYFIPFSISD